MRPARRRDASRRPTREIVLPHSGACGHPETNDSGLKDEAAVVFVDALKNSQRRGAPGAEIVSVAAEVVSQSGVGRRASVSKSWSVTLP